MTNRFQTTGTNQESYCPEFYNWINAMSAKERQTFINGALARGRADVAREFNHLAMALIAKIGRRLRALIPAAIYQF